jgi:hypothetical protein
MPTADAKLAKKREELPLRFFHEGPLSATKNGNCTSVKLQLHNAMSR